MIDDIYYTDYINIDGNFIHKTAVINYVAVEMGRGNIIGPYTCIGTNGEMRNKYFLSFSGKVHIGDNNMISEHVTIQRPYDSDGVTKIGCDNLIMAHCHIGHDAIIGNLCEISTSSVIGGHCVIGDRAKIKLNCTIRNRVKVGEDALVGMHSAVVKDVEAGKTVYGVPAKEKLFNQEKS